VVYNLLAIKVITAARSEAAESTFGIGTKLERHLGLLGRSRGWTKKLRRYAADPNMHGRLAEANLALRPVGSEKKPTIPSIVAGSKASTKKKESSLPTLTVHPFSSGDQRNLARMGG
jgi:hypothetical protein